MTYEFEYLMQLMGAASTGKAVAPPTQELNRELLFTLAGQQQILPLICHALNTASPPGYPDVFTSVLTYCARRGSVIALLEEMERAGIRYCVVKGFAAGVNYASPEYRISSDTDIVIDPKDEKSACEFLENHGFDVKPRLKKGHHSIATHPEMGMIEVHVQLYDELVEEVWFANVDCGALLREPRQQIDTPDGSYWTLGHTDHALFMALHLVKHFILCGMSLRMMTDLALAISRHREQFDAERFWSTLHSMNYSALINAVLWSTIRYCGFEADDFPGIGTFDDSHVQLILNDLEKGGWLGKNANDERTTGWYEYNRELLMKNKSKTQYRLYMLNWHQCFRLNVLFPGKELLSRNYPYVLKYPFLIPFAWIHRIFFRGSALLLGKTWRETIVDNENDLSDEGKERVAMFRRLGMM